MSPITGVVNRSGHPRLEELPTGSLFFAVQMKPDGSRMIDGTWKGASVMLFLRDLEERAVPIAKRAVPIAKEVQSTG